MSGMLNQGIGVLGSMDTGGLDPQALMSMLSMRQKDPFTRSMPGDSLLGSGGMSMPQMPQTPGLADTQINNPQQFTNAPNVPGMSTISTDFANTQPGLPNLPDSFLGFGYGQFAPKEVSTGPGGEGGMQGGMRQQMIMKMLQELLPKLQQSMQASEGPNLNTGMPSGLMGLGGF